MLLPTSKSRKSRSQKNILTNDDSLRTAYLKGQAEAEANRLKVAAGLTPQERAEWDYKTAVGIAEALSKSNVRWVPEIMVSGQGGGSTNAMDAVGMNMMLDIAKQIKAK